jgi:pyruvate,water dikinase
MRKDKMDDNEIRSDDLIGFLQEREKELNCLYRIEHILNQPDTTLADACKGVIEAIPAGLQYPDLCKVRITIEKTTFTSQNFAKSPWVVNTEIKIRDKVAGKISVYYTEEMPGADFGPFLEGEKRLLETIANRLSHFIIYNVMKQIFEEYKTARDDLTLRRMPEWRVVLNLLRQTDKNLFMNISRRMLNHLCWSGIKEADELLRESSMNQLAGTDESVSGDNIPHQKSTLTFSTQLSDQTFDIAANHMKDD